MSEHLRDYVLIEKLGQSLQARVYKGYHKNSPHTALTIKLLNLQSATDEALDYLQQKVERLKTLNDARTSTPLRLELQDDIPVLVHQWHPGSPLDQWLQQGPPSLHEFLTLACGLTEILHSVHEAGIIHGGIKPHNILVDGDPTRLCLIDFITPLDIRDVSHFIYDPGFVRNTLAYTSPEQTGRINHRVSFASDLYSLGVVLYELLLNQLPFFSEDPLELIHSHLAEEPQAINKNRPAIPEQLTRVVEKLLNKEPEKRYQSAFGLLIDLQRCQQQFQQQGEIEIFYLGLLDRNRRISFISKMVGRENESQQILEAYDDVVKGQFRSLFISGLSGIGKTRLIQELQKPLVKHRGYFTSGKFDQYQKNIPYSSLIQALRGLMRTFLTESDEQLQRWRQKISTALGEQAALVTEVIPELRHIVGEPPLVADLPPVEARNRFNGVLGRFLGALASKDNPLVLFIDDLQWCDIATFDFLRYVFANHQDYPFLFFMGAYRHNEVDDSHALIKLLGTIRENKAPLQEIRINELASRHCHQMVAYILDTDERSTASLAGFIAELTGGNPLFVSESLAYLYNEGLLYMNAAHEWVWDLENIRHSNMPTTVVALFSAKLTSLPEQTNHVMKYAACMGNRIRPNELALVLELSLTELFDLLKPVLNLGILLENKTDLQFVHDRVQEAVLTTINQDERRRIHWQIGQHLLSVIDIGTSLVHQDNLFTITSHLNQGRPPELSLEHQLRLCEVNMAAGDKALDALATEAANDFFHKAADLLPEDCWQRHYQLTYCIYQKLAKTELMCGRYSLSQSLIDELIDNARDDLDRTGALADQTTSLSSIGEFRSAIKTANRGLQYFNKAIPEDAAQAQMKMQSLMSDIASQGDVWQQILDMPFTRERKNKIELAFYSELIPDLYMSGKVPQLYLSAAQSTQHCLAGGMDDSVIYSFSIMGLYLGEQQQFELAFRYQDLAHQLVEKYPNTFGATRGINGIVWCNMHSRSHPADIVQYCLKGIQSGKNCGDLYNAGLNYGPLMWNLQVQGDDLATVEHYADECLQFSRKNQLSFSIGLAEAVQQGWIMPMRHGHTRSDISSTIAKWEHNNHIASAGSYFVLRGIALYFLGDYEAADDSFVRVNKYLTGLTDNVLKRQWMAFCAINAIRLFKQKQNGDKQQLLHYVQPRLEQVRTWCRLGPLLRPFLALLEAELATLENNIEQVRSRYHQAIKIAADNGYTLLQGHLYESLIPYLFNIDTASTRETILHAQQCYRRCHAEYNLALLGTRYPQHIPATATTKDTGSDNRATSPQASSLPDLDVNYLMKSALAISAELDLTQLLQKIMTTVIECSGAQHGYLIEKCSDTLSILAESHIKRQGNSVLTRQRELSEQDQLCLPIINYVFRTRESLLLSGDDALESFASDAMIRQLNLRSVMCLPVLSQGMLKAVLYLENRLSDAVFTDAIQQMIELITSQAATALENASLLEETRQAKEALHNLNETLEQRISEAVRSNRDKDLLLIQQARLASMGEMIGNIAHQWRQPLTTLGLILANIRDAHQYDQLTTEYLETTVNEGSQLVQSMSATIDDFKNFFRPDKQAVNFAASDQVNQALSLIATQLSNSDIDINVESVHPIRLHGHPNEYAQVLLNLLSNAREAIISHEVQSGRIQISIDRRDNMGCVSISDNGGGIPPEIIDKVFDPYFSTKEMGSGIGLYMSQMIIQRSMGGHIRAENINDGSGARFTIYSRLAD